jgi:hypothetical protein
MKCIRYSNLLLLISCLLASLLCTAQAIADVMGMDIEIRLYAWVQVRKQLAGNEVIVLRAKKHAD